LSLKVCLSYLLRTNPGADNPERLWRCYMQLVFVEEAFRTLKGDLGLRPIYHQRPDRIEAHLFVAFLAYGLSTTLRQRLKALHYTISYEQRRR
jgi:transposase